MIYLKIFLLFLLVGFNVSWYREARRDNGNFDKKEIVQWMLGNLFLGLFYCHTISIVFTEWHWGIIAGSLILSVGIQLYTETLKK